MQVAQQENRTTAHRAARVVFLVMPPIGGMPFPECVEQEVVALLRFQMSGRGSRDQIKRSSARRRGALVEVETLWHLDPPVDTAQPLQFRLRFTDLARTLAANGHPAVVTSSSWADSWPTRWNRLTARLRA